MDPAHGVGKGSALTASTRALQLVRRYRFSASHRYHRPDWSEAENRRRFGPCSNPPGHGHNYRLYVSVSGPVDPATGFLVDLGVLDDLVQANVLDVVDHQHLNYAVPEFTEDGGQIPTSENLVTWIAGRLAGELPAGVRLERLRLEEDEDLAVEWVAAG